MKITKQSAPKGRKQKTMKHKLAGKTQQADQKLYKIRITVLQKGIQLKPEIKQDNIYHYGKAVETRLAVHAGTKYSGDKTGEDTDFIYTWGKGAQGQTIRD